MCCASFRHVCVMLCRNGRLQFWLFCWHCAWHCLCYNKENAKKQHQGEATGVFQHRVKQKNITKERLKGRLCVLQHGQRKRTAPRRGWMTTNQKGKETPLSNFRCWNVSTCMESIAAHTSQSLQSPWLVCQACRNFLLPMEQMLSLRDQSLHTVHVCPDLLRPLCYPHCEQSDICEAMGLTTLLTICRQHFRRPIIFFVPIHRSGHPEHYFWKKSICNGWKRPKNIQFVWKKASLPQTYPGLAAHTDNDGRTTTY